MLVCAAVCQGLVLRAKRFPWRVGLFVQPMSGVKRQIHCHVGLENKTKLFLALRWHWPLECWCARKGILFFVFLRPRGIWWSTLKRISAAGSLFYDLSCRRIQLVIEKEEILKVDNHQIFYEKTKGISEVNNFLSHGIIPFASLADPV